MKKYEIKINNINPQYAEFLNDYTCYWIRSSATDYQADVATIYDSCLQCQVGTTAYFYQAQTCAGGPIEIISSDFELDFGDVYGFAELEGCWTILGEIAPEVGTYPTPNVAYINCAVCYGEPAGIFKTDRKQRAGFPETLCATSHTLSIYNGDVVDAADLQVGMTMWSDASQSIPWNGATLWYSISNGDTHTIPEVSVLINSVGMIKAINICSGGTCQIWTHGGYDIGEALYLDCNGIEQISYYNGPAASGFDQSSFCATKILSYTGSEPYQTLELC